MVPLSPSSSGTSPLPPSTQLHAFASVFRKQTRKKEEEEKKKEKKEKKEKHKHINHKKRRIGNPNIQAKDE